MSRGIELVQKSLNIIMLIPQLGYGGAEKSFVNLANYLSSIHHVTVVLFDSDFGTVYASNSAESLNSSIDVVYLNSKGNKISRWMNRWKVFRTIKKSADVSISFLSGTNLLNAFTFTGTKTIVSERGSKKYDILITGWKRILWLKVLDPLIYCIADIIVTVSKGLKHEIIENRRSIEHKVLAIEGYIDSKKLIENANLPIESEYKVLLDYPIVITAGRLSPQKGYKYLIETFCKVKHAVPNSKLFIIGDGPDFDSLESLVAQYGLVSTRIAKNLDMSDVIFAGYKEKPSRYFKLGKVFVFPSLYEGLPNALIEAVGAGIPVLAADCPWGVRSVLSVDVEDMGSIEKPVTVNPHTLLPMINIGKSVDIWAENIVDYLLNPRAKLSEVEMCQAIEKFDFEKNGIIWLKLIETLSVKHV